jgi:hypothetical protein
MKIRMKSCAVMLAAIALLTLAGSSSAGSIATPPTSNPISTLPPANKEWVWMSGSSTVNRAGTYGTQRTGAPSNTPGARVYASTWSDAAGNLWLFGGYGSDSTGASGDLNDLWEYDGRNWTWVSGSKLIEQPGTYGMKGAAAQGNAPGARYQAVSWRDTSGNFWLFGGLGIDSTGSRGRLNDLWKYSEGEWTWMRGSNLVDEIGIYGTKGTPDRENIPGGRVDAASWTDAAGDLWLFGGLGWDSTGTIGILNDLWKYNAGEWTWMGGSDTISHLGRYGTQGTPDPRNVPGARTNPVTWTDAAGNLWLFGGQGEDSTGLLCVKDGGGLPCDLNDLWKYSAGEWTWMGGSKIIAQPGVYGIQGAAAPGNFPGARDSAVGWTDASGNFWLFGGFGYDSTAGAPEVYGDLNDLWKFSGGEWTWVSGSNFAAQTGIYGMRGTPASGNVPGARDSAVSWIDASGNLWLFGGGDYYSMINGGKLNDLWKYEP